MSGLSFTLTVNPHRLASWADLLIAMDAPAADLGSAYDHARYPVLRPCNSAQSGFSYMRQGRDTTASAYSRELRGMLSRDDLNAAHCHRALQHRRCIVPADRIVGLHHGGTRDVGRLTMSLRSDRVFGLAAVWEEAPSSLPIFSVLTTPVSSSMHLLAECLPVVLADKDRKQWLDHSTAEIPQALIRPLSEEELCEWKLSPSLSR